MDSSMTHSADGSLTKTALEILINEKKIAKIPNPFLSEILSEQLSMSKHYRPYEDIFTGLYLGDNENHLRLIVFRNSELQKLTENENEQT